MQYHNTFLHFGIVIEAANVSVQLLRNSSYILLCSSLLLQQRPRVNKFMYRCLCTKSTHKNTTAARMTLSLPTSYKQIILYTLAKNFFTQLQFRQTKDILIRVFRCISKYLLCLNFAKYSNMIFFLQLLAALMVQCCKT